MASPINTITSTIFAALLLLLGACTSAAAVGTGYGPVRKGRTTFYGGAPDKKDPTTPSWGTLEGSCGCAIDLAPYTSDALYPLLFRHPHRSASVDTHNLLCTALVS